MVQRSVRRNKRRNTKRKSFSGGFMHGEKEGEDKGKGKGKKIVFEDPVLDKVLKLAVSGMTAMYVANILVNVGAVKTIADSLSSIIGIPSNKILYAAKGTGVAGVAERLHKELENK